MAPGLYQQYYIDKEDERRGLFRLLSEEYDLSSGMYPGSFVHITPAFYIPEMVFIDNDRRIDRFFKDERTAAYIEEHKTYADPSRIHWQQTDYSMVTGLQEDHYDILFSFYAGFISQSCKRFLRRHGILLANNSHGDASLAIADPDYEPVGVVLRRGDDFRIKTHTLEPYITKQDSSAIDTERVRERMIGERFSAKAYAYLFRKN